ncbi:hypothetical protein JYU34_016658 [Plutella xylostella]|uniref:Elongation of very long chain fatty acids protein n=1 Tax=Plutella xylostella TaxID=51655 RepID=A0ABQ7Q367_PLUXY|nr:hypothetical protein JYU34_016658 [Plutella xylostella]
MDTVPLKSVDFGFLHKSSYSEVDEFPLMQTPIPIAIIIVSYLLFVTKIGPAYMKNRKPFNLKSTLIIYNAVQVAYSAYLMARIGRFLSITGIAYSKCYLKDKEYTSEVLTLAWLYLFAKLTELLDTVFFVLRKKDNQISFLHVYHHIAMLIGSWLFLKYSPSDNIAFLGWVNSFVHVVMYAYYGLAAFGPHMQKYLTWKKYLTTLQLAQFVAQFLVLVAQINLTECPMPTALTLTVFGNNLLFIYLFGSFYYKNYIKKDKKSKSRLD